MSPNQSKPDSRDARFMWGVDDDTAQVIEVGKGRPLDLDALLAPKEKSKLPEKKK